MLLYATTEDYAAWTGAPAPAGTAGLLRSASLAVREATERAFYATDTTGLPTDAVYLQAFNDATCCQAAFLTALEVDPNAGGVLVEGVEVSAGIGTARQQFADSGQAAAAKAAALGGLCPDAKRILRNAGLMPRAPWVVG